MQAGIYEEFGGPIQVKEVPIPRVPLDGVLIQVMATGVCRSDWHGWKGHDGDVKDHGLPFCPGHEFSGVVVETGPRVRRVNKGDRVAVPFILSCGDCRYCCEKNQPTICAQQQQPGFTQWGSFAEYVAIPRADRNIRRLPRTLSFVQAAAIGCRFTTAYRALLQQGELKPGQSAAIFGCGGLGLSCLLLAVSQGASPIVAIDVSEEALAKAKSLGATHTIRATPGQTSEELGMLVAETIEADGVDLSIDSAGFSATSESAVFATRPGGRMVQVGLPHQPPSIPMGRVAGKEITIIGSHGFDAQELPDLLDLVANDPKLDPCQLVEREVTLQEGCHALESMDKQSPLGMIMITKFVESQQSLARI